MATILETDETGALVLPAQVLGRAQPHARYVLEAKGQTLVLRPEVEEAKSQKARDQQAKSSEQWMKECRELGEQISEAWPEDGPSAVEVITEMRDARGQTVATDH